MERQNRNTKSRAPLSVTLRQVRDISQSNGKTLTDTHATYRPGEENSPCPNQNYRIKLKQFHSIAVLRGKNCFESCIYRDRREWVSKWVAVPPRVRFFCLHSLKLSTVLALLIPLLIFIFPSFPLRLSPYMCDIIREFLLPWVTATFISRICSGLIVSRFVICYFCHLHFYWLGISEPSSGRKHLVVECRTLLQR